MKYRIALWASAGFFVAACWALYASAMFPFTNERMREVWTIVVVTCPVAVAGMHFPISLHSSLVANAGTYALVGLIVQSLRKQFHHASFKSTDSR